MIEDPAGSRRMKEMPANTLSVGDWSVAWWSSGIQGKQRLRTRKSEEYFMALKRRSHCITDGFRWHNLNASEQNDNLEYALMGTLPPNISL